MSGLYSPILEQAGFIKRKAAAVVDQYVAQLDGAMQSWALIGGIPLSSGDSFSFDAAIDPTEYNSYVFDDDSGAFNRLFLIVNPNSTITFRDYNINLKVDGLSYANGASIDFNDGLTHKFDVEVLQSVTLSKLGSRFNDTEKLKGYFKNLTVRKNNSIVNQIPLTNKAQGANQLATVGDVNAFMPNYTDAVWRKP